MFMVECGILSYSCKCVCALLWEKVKLPGKSLSFLDVAVMICQVSLEQCPMYRQLFPIIETKSSWIFFPILNESWVFPASGNYSKPCVSEWLYTPFRLRFFPQPLVISLHALTNSTLLNNLGRPPTDSLHVCLSLLWSSVLWTWSPLVSLDSQLCLLISWSSLGPTWIPPFYTMVWKLKTMNWSNCSIHQTCFWFLRITVFHFLMSSVLKLLFKSMFFLVVIQLGGKLSFFVPFWIVLIQENWTSSLRCSIFSSLSQGTKKRVCIYQVFLHWHMCEYGNRISHFISLFGMYRPSISISISHLEPRLQLFLEFLMEMEVPDLTTKYETRSEVISVFFYCSSLCMLFNAHHYQKHC
jgi:hypothetical protein